MKILYVTTIGATMCFFKEFIEELINDGHTVDIATNDSIRKPPECYTQLGCRIISLPCSRFPINIGNLKSISLIRELVKNEKYDIVHCHTPIAAACTRIACRKLRISQGVKVFYTAHGFHFYKGAPKKNWIVYYPIEKFCARYTDKLITINKEDYELAKKKLKPKEVYYVPGVGINISKFANVNVDKNAKRKDIGVPETAFLLVSVGELINRKNHILILQALKELNNINIHYLIVGKGPLLTNLKDFVNINNMSDRVHFLGYRTDIAELYKASDVCCFPSLHEGLPVALMEAMACGLPIVCSKIRGNIDLIDYNSELLFNSNSIDDCKRTLNYVLKSNWCVLGEINRAKVEEYSVDKIIGLMKKIYES